MLRPMPEGYSLPQTLRTQRIQLRPLTLGDVPAVFAYGADPQVSRYVTWPTHRSVADSLDFVQQVVRRYESGMIQTWALHHIEQDKLIGTIALDSIDDKNRYGTVGYVLARPWWNQGIMTEVLRAMLDCVFRTTPLNRIEACCDTRNPRSARVMQKSGMTFEGTRRQAHFFKEEFHDTHWYAILRDDWATMTRRG